MIDYKEHKLSNGLTVLAHRDRATQMAAVNILYKVGSRNEDPSRTGFAHLFEHLMFRGTTQVPDFDLPVQMASGENNAFTNNDYTDYYITLPAENVETALWLEADRMTGLDISPAALEGEKRVVIEEYNQRYVNQPYGDQWMLLREMAYRRHPYRWATIGQSIDHIAGASLEEVRAFYNRWYTPSNAILSVAGNISEEEVFRMAERWFGGIKEGGKPSVPGGVALAGDKADQAPGHADQAAHRAVESLAQPSPSLPVEPRQTSARRLEVTRDVPAVAITLAFHMGGRTSRQFYVCDMISDLLAGGSSARLYQSLVKERKLFSAVNAYVTGDIDPGLFVVTGHLLPGIPVGRGEEAIWDELRKLQTQPASDYELEKVKNKFEAGVIFGELNVMNKAMNLGFYSMRSRISPIIE